MLSIPISVLTSRESLGQALRQAGLFLTPEETASEPELASLERGLGAPDPVVSLNEPPRRGLREAVLDPYVNAIHVTLLREMQSNPDASAAFAALGGGSRKSQLMGERLLAEGPLGCSARELLCVLSDPDLMLWLHREVWTRPQIQLADWWAPDATARPDITLRKRSDFSQTVKN